MKLTRQAKSWHTDSRRRLPHANPLQVECLEDRTLLTIPLVDSWFTGSTGEYAQIINGANVAAGAVTTWTGVSTPTLGDVEKISYSSNWVYVKAPDLASYVMGPWFLDWGDTQVFPTLPTVQNTLVRFSRSPQAATTHTATSGGIIGMMVNGVALFNMLDTFSWNNNTQQDQPGAGGSGYWNRDANFAEEASFDHGRAHQPGSGQYHYHSNPTALRAQLDDNIAYTGATDVFPHDDVDEHSATFTHDFPYEEATSNWHHSPIIGWSFDGYPIYGPYGYSDPTDATSAIVRVESSFELRSISQRTSLPGWAAQKKFGENVTLNGSGEYTLASNFYGPAISAAKPLGTYAEDYQYVAGLGHLDKYNGRFTVTPEFPQGTYAYFITVDDLGESVFPYSVGPQYYGTVTGGSVASISESVTVAFDVNNISTGGITVAPSGGSTTIAEGGTTDSYTVVLTSQPTANVTIAISTGTQVSASSNTLTFTTSNWSTPQTVTLTAVDDGLVQGTRTATISHTVSSSDSNYSAFAMDAVSVTINDNDSAAGTTIGGTSGADKIVVAPSSDQASVLVTVNGTTTTLSASIAQLILDAGDGNDTIQLTTPNVAIAILGGNGTDKLLVYGQSRAANTFELTDLLLVVNGKSQTLQDLETVVVYGGTSTDTFTLSQIPAQPGLEFSAGTGVDRLIGPNTANTWLITASNGGTLNSTVRFTGVEGLTGGSAADTFTFSAGKGVTSTIDAGAGTDVFDYSAYTAAVAFNLQALTAGGTGGFAGVESFLGGKGSDKLIGVNQPNTWNVTSSNAGTLNGTTSFQGIENLMGGTDYDTFEFAAGAGVTGKIDGATGSDLLDFSSYSSAVTVNFQTGKASGVGSFTSIENVTGGSGVDTVQAANKSNTWTLTGANAGTIANVISTLTFAGVENLIGGTGTDTFQGSGSWSGTLDGSTGTDILVGDDGDHAWAITAANTGTVDGQAFKSVESLRGGSGIDTFTISAGKAVSGKIDGGAGTDVLDLSAFTTAVAVNLQTGKATGMAGLANVETFQGGAGTDTFTAASLANAWTLTGSNTGTCVSTTATYTYSGFENLTGGGLGDIFTLDPTGDWTGLLNGGAGTDSLIASSSVANVWTGTATGTLNGRKYSGIETRV